MSNVVRRTVHPDLHGCACQWPGLGTTIFFPGQKPLPDGHGVHSLPPPPRMYVPCWHGRHWPARGASERLGGRRCSVYQPRRVPCDRRATIAPASANDGPAERARTLFFDEAEAGAVAAEELQTTNTSSRGTRHFRLHGYSRRNDYARRGGSILSNCLYEHEYQKTRANQRAKPNCIVSLMDQSHRQRRSCRRIAKTCGDAPCPLS